MYKTDELQNMIIEFLNENDVEVKALRTKDDLTKVGTKPLSYIQFVSNTYKANKLHSFYANFNIYFVNKTLSNGVRSELLELLDSCRKLMIGAKVEYEQYVSKQYPVIIRDESFTETKSSVFVYTMSFSIDVRM